jgi:hypothetical protein
MLIVGQITTEEEKRQAILIADLFTIGEKFRNLARKQKKK